MKKVLLYSFYLVSVLMITSNYSIAQRGIKYPENKKLPEVKIYDSGKIENFKIKSQKRAKAGQEPTAFFAVTYNDFTEDAKLAFAKAVELWSYLIYSSDTIRINATWKELEGGVLGSCGPGGYFRDFKNAPVSNTWYPVVIANKLAGFDLDPENPDMNANFSSVFNWYLGLDGNCPTNQYDFISVVMHEIGHGLGFLGSGSVDGTKGSWGYDTGFPFIYDHYVINGDDQALINTDIFANPSSLLRTQLTSNNLFFKSELSDNANGSNPSKIYTPSTWNPGSSYSHLDNVFNGTENSMMTYSSGSGEVTHDPGPVTLAMFAEMGWISTRFDHKHINDMEIMSNPVSVNVEVFGDSAINSGSVLLHYSTDNFSTDNAVTMTTSNDTLYTYDIPVQADGTVKYYIEATNTLNRTYYYPSQGKFNVVSIDSTLSFIVGADIINPELSHVNEREYIFNFEETFEIQAEVHDNIGIDSVYVEYKLNDNAIKYLNLQTDDANPIIGLPIYNIDIPLISETLNDLDTLYYKLIAVDSSSNSNTTMIPQTGYYKISIHSLYTAETDTIIDFDETVDKSLFILDGFTISQPANFNSKGLHSPHPYEEGDNYPNNEFIYTSTLKIPIILGDSTKIRFEEIVLVEPGSAGNSYGDDEFWDYVIIEGSKDSGKTWHDFVDGYDCSIASSFTATYNSNTASDGTENMYLWHTFSLLENQNLVVGDEVLIRFKLWSDQLSVGWGWAIDNITIQNDIEAPTAPASLATTEITSSVISLIWSSSTDNFEVADYAIYKDDVLLAELTDTTYNATGLTESTIYSFYVKSRDIFGNISEASDTIKPETDSATGVEIIADNTKHLKLYPNPTNNYFNLEFISNEIINELNISIYSIDGKLVYSSNKQLNSKFIKEQINVENINTGIYIIKVNTGKDVITERLLIK